MPQGRRFSAILVGGVIATADVTAVVVAAAIAFLAYFWTAGADTPEPARYVLTSLFSAGLFVAFFERFGGYRLKRLASLQWQLTRILTTWCVSVACLLAVAFIGKLSIYFSRGWATTWVMLAAALLMASRSLLHPAMTHWMRNGRLGRNVVIVGAGEEGQRLIAKLQKSRDPSFVIRGVFDDRTSRRSSSVCGLNVLGTTDDLLRFARRVVIDEVIVALPLDAEARLKGLFDKLKGIAVDVRLSVETLAQRFEVRGMSYLGEVPVLEIADRPLKSWRAAVKYVEDKIIAAVLLVFMTPLLVVIIMAIKLNNKGPVFFVQERFGFNNNIIRVLKFRTMYVEQGDQSGADRTVRNDPRVTRVGAALRWLSLDELPQLINVLRGDMSLVGPRPHAIAMRAGDRLYGEAVAQYLHRHRVKPGITGWAQVNGLRGEVDTLDKARARVAHDLDYIEHWTPWLDLKILLMTTRIVVSGRDAY